MFHRTPADLVAFAAERGVVATLHHAPGPMPTVEAAAAALGIMPEQMSKNVLFLVAGAPWLAIGRGRQRVDTGTLARHSAVSKKKVRLATPAQTLAYSGFAAGCVPPFGHRVPLPTVVDRSVLALPRLYGGTSEPTILLSILPDDLFKLTEAAILPLHP